MGSTGGCAKFFIEVSMTPECKISFPDLGEYRAYFRPIQDPDKRWTSIEDATPPEGEEVLFCCQIDDGHPNGSYFTEVSLGVWHGAHTNGGSLALELDDNDWRPCTHWMPLPAVPRLPE